MVPTSKLGLQGRSLPIYSPRCRASPKNLRLAGSIFSLHHHPSVLRPPRGGEELLRVPLRVPYAPSGLFEKKHCSSQAGVFLYNAVDPLPHPSCDILGTMTLNDSQCLKTPRPHLDLVRGAAEPGGRLTHNQRKHMWSNTLNMIAILLQIPWHTTTHTVNNSVL